MKAYFSLTAAERKGVFILMFIVALLFIILKVRQLSYKPESIDLSSLQDSVFQYYNSPNKKEKHHFSAESKVPQAPAEPQKTKQVSAQTEEIPLIVEINAATLEELCQIKGVGEFYAKGIIEERRRLGGFTQVEQLLSLYGMTSEKLNKISSQIRIDTSLLMPVIPLNSADSSTLVRIPDISSYCAASIVTYREKLGGFYDSRQLLELSAIGEERYASIMHRLILDSIPIRQLDINNDDFKTILKHPYIGGYENTKAIFRYLDYGEIKTWNDLKNIPYLNLENPERLKPYIKFEPKRKKKDAE